MMTMTKLQSKSKPMSGIFRFSLFFMLIVCPCFGQFDEFDDAWDFPSTEPVAAELLPEEVNLFVGDIVQIYGILKDLSPISNLYFQVESNQDNAIVLSATIVNATHSYIDLEGSEKIGGRRTLSFWGTRDGGAPEQLTSMNFFVLNRLQNVTNVDSVWYYPNKTLDVRWDLGVNYDNPVTVETKWVANDKTESGHYICSRGSNTFCRLDKVDQSILFFHMEVKVKDFWWNVYLENEKHFLTRQTRTFPHLVYEVVPKTKVQPIGPSRVEVVGRTSRCFNISWNESPYFNDMEEDASFRVIFYQDGKMKKNYSSVLPYSHSGQPVEVCGLHPDTRYVMSLEVKPLVGGYWSIPVETFHTTLESRPSSGPFMTDTSFLLGVCDKGNRDVILYWRDVKENEKNGKLTDFVVNFNAVSGEVRHSSNHMKAQLACNVTYNVEVYSRTKIGLTENPSRLTIPREDNVLHSDYPVDLKVEKLTTMNLDEKQMDVNVMWSNKDSASLHGVSLIVYFCSGQTFSNDICIDDFSYQVVPYDQLSAVLTNISSRTDRFGYALEKDRKSLSGITWTSCMYHRNKQPGQVTGVTAHPGDAVGSILVMWDAQRCSKDTVALVLVYHVRYYSSSRPSSWIVVPVDEGDSSHLVIKDLDAEDTYTVQVGAEAFNGTGLYSTSVTSKPHKSAIGDDATLGTMGIILIIICVLVVGAVLSICFWKIRKRKQDVEKTLYSMFASDSEDKLSGPYLSDSGISSNTLKSSVPFANSDSSGIQTGHLGDYEIMPALTDTHQSTIAASSLPGESPNPPNPLESVSTTDVPIELKAEVLQAQAVGCFDSVTSESNSPNHPGIIETNDKCVVGGNIIAVAESCTGNKALNSGTTENSMDYVKAGVKFTGSSSNSTSDDYVSNAIASNTSTNDDSYVVRAPLVGTKSQDPIQSQMSADPPYTVCFENGLLYFDRDDGSTNTSNTGESSSGSRDPYVKVSNLDQFPIDTTSSGSDYTSAPPPPGQTRLISPVSGSQTQLVPIHEAGCDSCVSPILLPTFQNITNQQDTSSQCGTDERSSSSNSNSNSNIQPYVQCSDLLPNKPKTKEGCGGQGEEECNATKGSLQVGPTRPLLCQRKISEDSGVSSPSVHVESPDFAETSGPNFTPFASTCLPLGRSSDGLFSDSPILVDVSALCTGNALEDEGEEEEDVSARSWDGELSGNDDRESDTDTSVLELEEDGNSNYV